MDNLPISHINCHMPGIADQISWLCIRIAYLPPYGSLGIGITGDVNAKVGIDIAGKPTAVSSGIRILAAPYIRVADKAQCIIDHIAPADARAVSGIWDAASGLLAFVSRTAPAVAALGLLATVSRTASIVAACGLLATVSRTASIVAASRPIV